MEQVKKEPMFTRKMLVALIVPLIFEQLLNVFVGQMSLIGPRPALPCEVVQYDARAMRRLTVKPGCGGAWQAGERSDSTFEGMVDADLAYIEKSSFSHDIGLMFGTLRSMFDGEGAY